MKKKFEELGSSAKENLDGSVFETQKQKDEEEKKKKKDEKRVEMYGGPTPWVSIFPWIQIFKICIESK